MNQLNPASGDGAAKQGTQAPGTGQSSPAGNAALSSAGSPAPAAAKAVAGPFTVRDLVVFGSVLLLFVASLLPMFGRYNLWNINNLFFLGLGIVLPLIVAALFAARRLQPQNAVRIGSLSVDQFASVVASFSVAFFFLGTAGAFSGYLLLGLVGALALLGATVLAPHVPLLRDDFRDRPEAPAHPVARDAVAPFRKPAAPKPVQKAAAPGPVQSGPVRPGPAQSGAAQPTAAVPAAGPVAGAPASGGPFAVVPAPLASAAPAPAAAEANDAGAPASASGAPSAAEPSAGDTPESPTDTEVPADKTEAPEGGTPGGSDEAPAREGIAATMAHPVVDRTQEAGAKQQESRTVEPIGATVDPASRPEEDHEQPAYEAFWFAVPQPRVAVDEHSGAPAFTIQPGGWVLALEDRGEEFLVQNTDGRLGVLRDLSHIERG
ncbi:hypothetical protein BIU82_08875 [Arthrobacter sp. SW1]|uniref:hypothetical protein n=1 Tax=Arthrobacter sp. SW1 TaxID=1920889 RepID=UPI000877C997|nr:hypothetical protein [Arthrobacter sp. SW1]OFI37202.1 hypothetical protein BIU82_08875 [Arthrobacter sp. SW1]